jgi:hypothetical protein
LSISAVASYTEAWIEIVIMDDNTKLTILSLPLRERGLKVSAQ